MYSQVNRLLRVKRNKLFFCCDGGNETQRNLKLADVLSVILTSKRIFQVSELLRKYRTF